MQRKIYLAGGCFWGMQAYFSKLKGLISEVGYANGNTKETNYQKVASTNHAEVIKIIYDDLSIRTAEIIDRFMQIIDPFSLNRQANDAGTQYRTGIFFEKGDLFTKKIAELFKGYIEKINGKKSCVVIEEIKNYVKAEEYHQDYLEKNPTGYCHINPNAFFNSLSNFKKLDIKEIQKLNLDKQSLGIMLNKETEHPHSSEFNLHTKKGIYIDKISKEPLFLSEDKYDAGCGWPSFTRPIFQTALNYFKDNTLAEERIEVTSKIQDSHLGHVFPALAVKTVTGLRYCINGFALEFIEFNKLKDTVYEKYQFYFTK